MKRILVGIGTDQSVDALTGYAIELSRRLEASVTAIGILDLPRLRVAPSTMSASRTAQHRFDAIDAASSVVTECIDEFVSKCHEAKIPFGVKREAGAALDALLDTARYYDLLVCNLGGMFEHGIVSEPPDELRQVVESGISPVLAVGDRHQDVSRVLVSLSESVESAAALRSYARLNPFPKATTKLIHFGDGQTRKFLDEAQSYLNAYGIDCETVLTDGKPKSSLLPLAREMSADLIVMGSSAKSLLRQRVFGETALRLFSQTEFPLFVGR